MSASTSTSTTYPFSRSYKTSDALVASVVVKGTAGSLFQLTGVNTKATAQYIQIHDSATLPAEAAVPRLKFIVPPFSADTGTGNFSFVFDGGWDFANGIVICNSSTLMTKTIGSADCSFDVRYS